MDASRFVEMTDEKINFFKLIFCLLYTKKHYSTSVRLKPKERNIHLTVTKTKKTKKNVQKLTVRVPTIHNDILVYYFLSQ